MQITVTGQHIAIVDDTLVSNSVNIYECEFEFDSSWDGFSKTSVWQLNSDDPIEVVINSGVAVIPHEVLENAGILRIGVYGTKDEKVMPTVWLEKRKVCLGTPTGSIGTEPTPSIYAQILAVATEAKEIAEDVQTEWESVSATAETLPSDASATASFDGEVFSFGIPQGQQGERGEQGIQGIQGEKGDKGDAGVSPQVTVRTILGGHRITITDSDSISQFDVMDGARGQQGEQGVGITDIQLTADYGLQITLSNGTVFITSSIRGEQGETGNGIASIEKTATVGKVDTYTITYTDGTTTTFEVTNGEVTEASLEERLIDKADVIENTASGTIVSFSDGAEMPVKSLEVEINAVQDLHGQANPYPSGGQLWDEQWESGSYDANGQPVTDNTRIRTKNAITVSPSTAYYFLAPNTLGIRWYDSNDDFITGSAQSNLVITSPSNAQYLRFSAVGMTSYNNSISVNYPSSDHTYHPYSNICPISGWDAVNVYDRATNMWDEEWEVGGIDGTTGENAIGNNRIRSQNYIPIKPSTAYYANFPTGFGFYPRFYDAEKTYIGNGGYSVLENASSINTPSTANYMRFWVYKSGWTATYNHDISINYPSTDTEYHAYNGTTYPITLPSTCYGGSARSDNKLVATMNEVDLSTLTWRQSSTATADGSICYFASISDMATDTANSGMISDRYKLASDRYINQMTANTMIRGNGNIFIATSSGTPIGQLVYPLATPIEITLSDYPTIETVKGVNNLWGDSGDVAVIYRADTKAYIDGTIVDVPLAMIAPIETGTKSSKAYAVGEYFILNGNQFCKAKTSIASGATFTLNTNYTITTIGAELKALA